MAKANTGTRGAANNGGDGASVSQLREIIFGEQMENYELRFATLEKKTQDDVESLKASLASQISELKQLAEEQRAELSDRSVERLKLADLLEGVAAKLRR